MERPRACVFSLLLLADAAAGSVYLGVKRQDIGETSPISGNSAALAPIFASVTLGGLYLCLKYTGLNPGSLYQFFACLFALLATADLLQPLLGLGLANELLAPASQDFGEKREAEIMNLGALPAFAVSLALIVAYAQGPETTGGALTTPAFAALNDCLGWSITMAALGVLALESFTAAAALLLGLFLYDAFFVFKSDVMLTVATQIEAPAKFLFARLRAEGDASYPFSVLGLGDVVVPGAFVSLLREVDKDGLEPAEGSRPRAPPIDAAKAAEAPSTYFRAGLGAYTVGLAGTFAANYLTKSGQPALVYIVPSLLITALATAAARGELEGLLAYRSSRAAQAVEARRQWKERRAAEKEQELRGVGRK